MRELHLFAGAGGGILGGMLLGHRPVCAVEIEPFCRDILSARQSDGILPNFPIFKDICAFDGNDWKGRVDVVCGGFPCQDISSSGTVNGQKGINGERSGLWREMARVIREIGPKFVFVENSPMLSVRGLDRVLLDLAEMGFDARWAVLGADDLGFCHHRKRLWILAHPSGIRRDNWFRNLERKSTQKVAKVRNQKKHSRTDYLRSFRSQYSDEFLAGNYRGSNGISKKLDGRIKALGNAQVPAVAAVAFRMLSKGLNHA